MDEGLAPMHVAEPVLPSAWVLALGVALKNHPLHQSVRMPDIQRRTQPMDLEVVPAQSRALASQDT
jgi:hypothetical protein